MDPFRVTGWVCGKNRPTHILLKNDRGEKVSKNVGTHLAYLAYLAGGTHKPIFHKTDQSI
jgi:hypothetical protein